MDGQSSTDRKARKGDNIFSFTAAHGLSKKRAEAKYNSEIFDTHGVCFSLLVWNRPTT